mmetsp:Transcript_34855/g.76673  ORF Transcript_34855/g.76673 Transcript_34855/m.76673 type:complete len:234 (-) Transcript_34855:2-703(-)
MLLCVASRVWRASRELRAQHGAARTQLNGLSLSRTSWTASSRLSCAPPPLLPSPPPSSSATPNSLASAALSSLIASSYASTEKQLAACASLPSTTAYRRTFSMTISTVNSLSALAKKSMLVGLRMAFVAARRTLPLPRVTPGHAGPAQWKKSQWTRRKRPPPNAMRSMPKSTRSSRRNSRISSMEPPPASSSAPCGVTRIQLIGPFGATQSVSTSCRRMLERSASAVRRGATC